MATPSLFATVRKPCGWKLDELKPTEHHTSYKNYRYVNVKLKIYEPKARIRFNSLRFSQENHEYHVRIFARNEVGLSEPLESEDPFRVTRPPGKYFLLHETIELEPGTILLCVYHNRSLLHSQTHRQKTSQLRPRVTLRRKT